MPPPGRRLVLITGCSGGGKSTLLAELASRGFQVVEEPGRRIVLDDQRRGGSALPWVDLSAFLHRAVELSRADLDAAADANGLVFFDRGLVDAISALQALRGEPVTRADGGTHRYDEQVFLAPPWPQIYRTDAERLHGYDEAVAEYERLARDVPALGYTVTELPRRPVHQRADFMLAALGATTSGA